MQRSARFSIDEGEKEKEKETKEKKKDRGILSAKGKTPLLNEFSCSLDRNIMKQRSVSLGKNLLPDR